MIAAKIITNLARGANIFRSPRLFATRPVNEVTLFTQELIKPLPITGSVPDAAPQDASRYKQLGKKEVPS